MYFLLSSVLTLFGAIVFFGWIDLTTAALATVHLDDPGSWIPTLGLLLTSGVCLIITIISLRGFMRQTRALALFPLYEKEIIKKYGLEALKEDEKDLSSTDP